MVVVEDKDIVPCQLEAILRVAIFALRCHQSQTKNYGAACRQDVKG